MSIFLSSALLVHLALLPVGAHPDPPKTKAANDSASSDSASSDSAASDSAGAEETPPASGEILRVYEEVDVRERGDNLVGIATSSSEGTIGRADLARRPIQRAGEVLEAAPGVVATQHSGGGKANQFFVRGFNLDHGTDFSVRVAGVPVNMPSHGHGQGYADLGFLIPELVGRVRYRKGPYFADVGDFSAAGSANIELVRSLPEAITSVSVGTEDTARALWASSFTLGRGELVAAVEGFQEDGPWTRAQDYDGYRGMLRYGAHNDRGSGYSLTFMGYQADWLSTDQVPRRAVDDGLIDRFDLIDPGPRGNTERFSLSGEWHHGNDRSLFQVSGFLLYYDFGLISNFTYFLDDPVNGDQFEQTDRRWVGGFNLRRDGLATWSGRRVEWSAGLDARFDRIDNGLFRTRDLDRLATVREDGINQSHGGLWADTTIHWSDVVRTRFGLRADLYSADVDSDLETNSGSETDAMLSPKASLILGPFDNTEFYVNLGYGFHSNDARGAVIAIDPVDGQPTTPVDPLVRATGFDVGVRTRLAESLTTTVTLFALELDAELLFVGDGGATEASRPSRRLGIEWSSVYRPSNRLAVDLDVTVTDATFTDEAPEGDEIPGAIGTTIGAGLSLEDLGPFFAALRWRYFGDIALIEDGSAEWGSTSLVSARVGHRFSNGIELALDVFNLFDRDDSDIEYFYASRLPGEPAGGVEDVHFHPVEPRTARLTLTWRY